MGRIGLQLRATLENITRLRAEGEDFRWFLKLKCGNCGEVSDKWQYLRLMDSVPLKGGRGSATMVQKCKLCSRENSIEILSQTIKSYNAEDSEKFKTIVEFECRGLEPVDFQPQFFYSSFDFIRNPNNKQLTLTLDFFVPVKCKINTVELYSPCFAGDSALLISKVFAAQIIAEGSLLQGGPESSDSHIQDNTTFLLGLL